MKTGNSRKLAKASNAIPGNVMDILGSPPLLSTEDSGAYELALRQLADAILPEKDLIAWFLIKDLADLRVEIGRYRRLKAALVLKVTKSHAQASAEWLKIQRRESDANSDRHIAELRTATPSEHDFASSFQGWITPLEQLDALTRAAEERFRIAVRELENHLSGLGPVLKANLNKLIEGEVVPYSRERCETGDATAASLPNQC